jgi:hypothetical protein
MKVILFGASGMVGQGCLRECLVDPGVETVLSVGRRPTGQQHGFFGDRSATSSPRHEFRAMARVERVRGDYDSSCRPGQTMITAINTWRRPRRPSDS